LYDIKLLLPKTPGYQSIQPGARLTDISSPPDMQAKNSSGTKLGGGISTKLKNRTLQKFNFIQAKFMTI
jgi:hypothetical protein